MSNSRSRERVEAIQSGVLVGLGAIGAWVCGDEVVQSRPCKSGRRVYPSISRRINKVCSEEVSRHTYPDDRAAIIQGVRCRLQAVRGRSASIANGSKRRTHAREVLPEPEGPQISVMVPRPSPELVAPRRALSWSRPVDIVRGPRDCRLRSASEAETVGRRSDSESDLVYGQLVDTRPTGRWRRGSRRARRGRWRWERNGRFRHVDGATDSHRP